MLLLAELLTELITSVLFSKLRSTTICGSYKDLNVLPNTTAMRLWAWLLIDCDFVYAILYFCKIVNFYRFLLRIRICRFEFVGLTCAVSVAVLQTTRISRRIGWFFFHESCIIAWVRQSLHWVTLSFVEGLH